MSNILVGCDPEMALFVSDEQYSGILPAAFVLEEGQRLYPDIVNTRWKENLAIGCDAGKIIVDGISLELNPLAGTPKQLVESTRTLLMTVNNLLQGCTTDCVQLEGIIRPAAPLDVKQLELWGDPMLAMFGCDPDRTIYSKREVDPRKINARTHPYRYFGGHIHIGWPKDPKKFYADSQNIYDMIILCDALLGSVGLMFDQVVEEDASTRRKVYGQPGVFRHQPHGLEYRTITNSWLLSPKRMKIIFSLVELIPLLLEKELLEVLYAHELEIRRMLIEGNLDAAIFFAHYVTAINETAQTQVKLAIELIDEHVKSWQEEWII